MSPRTRIVLSVALAAATATVTAACSTGAKTSKPVTASPVAVTVTTASPAPSVQATPTTTPTASPPAPKGPDGRITIKQLTAHKVTIPAKWLQSACPSGLQQLHRSTTNHINHDPSYDLLHVYKVIYTNLDGDTSLETAALVTCQYGEAATAQVIVFDRDSAGHIVTKGTVLSGYVWSLTARSGGGVTVDISDTEACCSTPKTYELHQTRSYAYQSGHFAQVAGPTSFLPHSGKIDLAIKVSSVSWSEKRNDLRTGTITVKVTNNSAVTSGSLLLIYSDLNNDPITFKLSALAGHATLTKTIKVNETDDGYRGGHTNVSIHELGSGPNGDANPKNDWAMITMWY